MRKTNLGGGFKYVLFYFIRNSLLRDDSAGWCGIGEEIFFIFTPIWGR